MKIRIVSDSASNIYEIPGVDYVSVPMKICVGDKVYVDDPELNVLNMMEEVSSFRGKVNTAHPSIKEWTAAFGDADIIFGVTVTSKLSGSYNAATFAADEYMEQHPDRQVFILDSRSTGPEMELIIEKYIELSEAGNSFREITQAMRRYVKKTHCWWSLVTINNFVNTGRVKPAVASIVKIFGINVVGCANAEGELEPTDKIKGTTKAVKSLYSHMQKKGYVGGKVRIRHSYNKEAADLIANIIRAEYPEADIKIGLNKGLCGFYVEKGGLELAFEGAAD